MSDTKLLTKSKPESARRLEVFTGSGRRRVWGAEQKARIVAETYGSGETVSAVARRHGLTPQQLFGWRRLARQESRKQSAESVGPCARTKQSARGRIQRLGPSCSSRRCWAIR
jgi:transposase